MFANYRFTGTLRPHKKLPQVTVSPEIQQPDYSADAQGRPLSEIADKRENSSACVYNAEQILGIREACRIGRKVLDIGGQAVRVGATGDEINQIVHQAIIDEGAYPSPLNYYNFPKSICVSVNECICHGIPDARPFEDGDIVNLDISVFKNGYHADLNETFLVGDSIMEDEASLRLVECAYNTLKVCIEMAKPGVLYRHFSCCKKCEVFCSNYLLWTWYWNIVSLCTNYSSLFWKQSQREVGSGSYLHN